MTRGHKCPYCANRKLCDENKNCSYCLNKTFGSVERHKCWSSKNKVKPNNVFKSTSEKYWFNCDKCSNEFESKLSHITNGSWCPNCRYKTEEKMKTIMLQIYPLLICQYKVEWCKNIKHLPFDFVIEDKKIIIELDGICHFTQVAKWKSPEHNRQRDFYKMKCANENGYSVIRILQEDVLYDKYKWLDELIINIEKIVEEKKVQNIYMCKNNEYKDFEI
jgi:very-short-patch-repair endonuclease